MSLASGIVIEPAEYMSGSDLTWFEPIFSREEIVSGGFPNAISARMFGNVVLVGPLDRIMHPNSQKSWIIRRGQNRDWDILASQFIDHEAVAALENNNARQFFASRVRLIHQKARELVGDIDAQR